MWPQLFNAAFNPTIYTMANSTVLAENMWQIPNFNIEFQHLTTPFVERVTKISGYSQFCRA